MKIHIGRLIEERLEIVGMKKAEFGRRINTSRQNVNTLLKRDSVDTDLLHKIGKVLNHDFFKYYRDLEIPKSQHSPKVKLVIELPELYQERIFELLTDQSGQDLLERLFSGKSAPIDPFPGS